MATVPTNKMERELRKLYLRWLGGLDRQTDVPAYISQFQADSTKLIKNLGGQAASLGALAGFPVPKTLELSPVLGVVYDEMQQAAISASITAGLNSKDAARQMLNAGIGKGYKRLERLARTETVSAYWKNQWNSAADLPMIVMVWGSEESKRTCDYCLSRDGYVVEDGKIRDHPNGRCTLIPTLRSRVAYKGTLQPDGSVFMDPAWATASRGTVPEVAPRDSVPNVTSPSRRTQQPAIQNMNFTPDELSAGTRVAERQRVSFERQVFTPKGRLNAAKGWTAENRRSWTSYTEGGGRKMNDMLRDPKAFAKTDLGSDPEFSAIFSKQIDDLTGILSKNELTDDIVVARGVVPAPGFDPSKLKSGDTFADPAFLSTTTNMKDATDFATGRGSGAEGWTFITKAPKGTNAVAGADYQSEIIFKPGQAQRVIGMDTKNRTVYTEMLNDVKNPVEVPGSKVVIPVQPAPVAATSPRIITSVKDMENFGAKMPVPSTLTPKAAKVVDDYAKGTAYTANAVLRGQKTYLGRPIDARTKAYTKGFTKDMDKMMDASIIPEDVRVVRALGADAFGGIEELQKLVGGIYQDKGYMSTSLASKTSSAVYDVKDSVAMEITVPKGSRGVYMAGESYLKSERELLLDRGTRLAVQSVTYDEKVKQWKVKATVVPSPR